MNLNEKGTKRETKEARIRFGAHGCTLDDPKWLKWCDTTGFFISGLVNTLVFAIFLSASADLLHGHEDIPKSAILLCNILPSLFIKLVAPYCMHRWSYMSRVTGTVIGSILALHIAAWTDVVALKLVGVAMGAFSQGLNEVTFLALCSFYPDYTLTAWSAGTGFAGIVGSVGYVILASVLRLELHASLSLLSIFPLMQIASFAFLLSRPFRDVEDRRLNDKTMVSCDGSVSDEENATPNQLDHTTATEKRPEDKSMYERLLIAKSLLMPYALPFFVVYFCEFTINFSVFYAMVFPLEETFFAEPADHFRYYHAIYQVGVFLSRASVGWITLRHTWIPSLLQVFNLVFFLCHAVYQFIPNVYIVFALIFWEGLMGGSAYANTYNNIRRFVPPVNREFSMAFVSISDAIGITTAGLTGLFLEPYLSSFNQHCLGCH